MRRFRFILAAAAATLVALPGVASAAGHTTNHATALAPAYVATDVVHLWSANAAVANAATHPHTAKVYAPERVLPVIAQAFPIAYQATAFWQTSADAEAALDAAGIAAQKTTWDHPFASQAGVMGVVIDDSGFFGQVFVLGYDDPATGHRWAAMGWPAASPLAIVEDITAAKQAIKRAKPAAKAIVAWRKAHHGHAPASDAVAARIAAKATPATVVGSGRRPALGDLDLYVHVAGAKRVVFSFRTSQGLLWANVGAGVLASAEYMPEVRGATFQLI
jgi:predicted outer membrane protein